MIAIAPMTLVAFVAWASLVFAEESSSASQPQTQSVKEELRQAGKHVGNAARVAAERTKEACEPPARKPRRASKLPATR
jgi:type II secretory pathway component PulJ